MAYSFETFVFDMRCKFFALRNSQAEQSKEADAVRHLLHDNANRMKLGLGKTCPDASLVLYMQQMAMGQIVTRRAN